MDNTTGSVTTFVRDERFCLLDFVIVIAILTVFNIIILILANTFIVDAAGVIVSRWYYRSHRVVGR